jgi:hypothetical protein
VKLTPDKSSVIVREIVISWEELVTSTDEGVSVIPTRVGGVVSDCANNFLDPPCIKKMTSPTRMSGLLPKEQRT